MATVSNPTPSARSSSALFPPDAIAALSDGRNQSRLVDTSAWALLQQHSEGGLKAMMQSALNTVMLLERELFLQAAANERTPDRAAYANGFRDRSLNTGVGTLDLNVPQTRGLPGGPPAAFYPSVLERGMRSEQALIYAIADMYFTGVSTRKVDVIVKQLGLDGISSSTVSRYAAELDHELEKWRQKPLGETIVVIFDARYESVRVDGHSRSCAVLSAIGIMPDGRRTILGVSVSLSEAEVHWRDFMESLTKRGLCGVRLIISDAHKGLGEARKKVFGSTPWQRCQFHLAQNAQHHCTTQAMRETVATEIRRIFDAETRSDADRLLAAFVEKYAKTHSQISKWAEENIPEGLTVLSLGLDKKEQKYLRTSNAIERCIQQEIKRRTLSVRIFPNTLSLLRLVSARLAEMDDEWLNSPKRTFLSAVVALTGNRPKS